MNNKNNSVSIDDVSVIIPSYNTLNYTMMAYRSIRQYYPNVEVVMLDDGSTDGTQEWLFGCTSESGRSIQGQIHGDDNLRGWRNTTGNILGHTITYDLGIKMARSKLVTIFHSDMICGKNYLENLIKHWEPKTVVCATRIEPEGIYPPGKEKILKPFGIEFHEFKRKEFEAFVEEELITSKDKTSAGIFAPWMISKEDFLAIGGHDAKHFAPYPEEDADLFLRYHLVGYKLIQSRDSLCWHWISRGHRSWAKNGVGKDDDMFKFYQNRARRNYLRKWHRWMQYDENRHPIKHKVYDTVFIIRDVTMVDFIHAIEIWASVIYIDNISVGGMYIRAEQLTTKLNLNDRIRAFPQGAAIAPENDVVIEFSQKDFMANGQENMGLIQNLSALIEDSAEPNSVMELGCFKMTTKSLTDISSTLIKI